MYTWNRKLKHILWRKPVSTQAISVFSTDSFSEFGEHSVRRARDAGMLILGHGLKAKFLGLGVLWPWP